MFCFKSNSNKILISIITAFALIFIINFCIRASTHTTPNDEAHKAYYEFVDYLKANVSVEGFDFTTVDLKISLIFSYERNLDDMGYAFLDINYDGIDELFIGYTSEYFTGYLLGLYTFEEGEIKHIIKSEHRDFIYLLDDFTLHEEGSSAYNLSYASIYEFENNNIIKSKSYIFQPIKPDIPDNCTWFEVLTQDKEYTLDYAQLRQLSEYEISEYYKITKNIYEINYIPLKNFVY